MALSPTSSHGSAASSLAVAKTTLTSGSLTTTSAAFVDATGVAATVVTSARRCLVCLIASVRTGTAGTAIDIDLAIDGVAVGGTAGLMELHMPASNNANGGFAFITDVLTAASHTFQVRYRSNGVATVTFFATTATPATLSVVELATAA